MLGLSPGKAEDPRPGQAASRPPTARAGSRGGAGAGGRPPGSAGSDGPVSAPRARVPVALRLVSTAPHCCGGGTCQNPTHAHWVNTGPRPGSCGPHAAPAAETRARGRPVRAETRAFPGGGASSTCSLGPGSFHAPEGRLRTSGRSYRRRGCHLLEVEVASSTHGRSVTEGKTPAAASGPSPPRPGLATAGRFRGLWTRAFKNVIIIFSSGSVGFVLFATH